MGKAMLSERKNVFLGSEIVQSMMDVAGGSIEGAEYFVERYKQILGPKADSSLIKNIEHWLTLVVAEQTKSQAIWDGKFVHSYANLQINLSDKAVQSLENSIKRNVHLDFAINDDVALVRGYSANNEALMGNALDVMDTSFNAWLAEQGMMINDSVLYLVEPNGQLQRDASGTPIKADLERIKALIQDDKAGFAAYMDSKGIQLTIQQHAYPQADVTPSKTIGG